MIRIATNSFSWHSDYNVGIEGLSALDICRQAARAGAKGIEMDPERISAADLKAAGIALSGASTGGPLFDEWSGADADKVVASAEGVAGLGGQYVFFTAAPKGGWGSGDSVTEDDLARAGERLSEVAARVRELGVGFGLHNHAASPGGLAAELALVTRYSDPALVGLYLDTGWAYCSDGDPVALIGELGPRLMGVHLRNHTPGGVPTEALRGGALDMRAVVHALVRAGYEGWVALELWHRQDVPVTRPMIECQAEAVADVLAWLASAQDTA